MRLKQSIIYEKVCESLERDRVYLQPALSLSGLSVIVGTNTTYLSNTINSCFGRNFRTLINDFRIGFPHRLRRQPVSGRRREHAD